MTGVIFLIQLIHYPSFNMIDKQYFVEFHSRHTQALGWVAGPFMLAELLTALWLARLGNGWFVVNALLTGILWVVTFAISVPYHHQLESGFDEKAWKGLTKSNWLRTTIWCGRSLAFLLALTLEIKVSV